MNPIDKSAELIVNEIDQRDHFNIDELTPGQKLELDFYPSEKKEKSLRLVIEVGNEGETRIYYASNEWKQNTPIVIHGSRILQETGLIAPGQLVAGWFPEAAVYDEGLAKAQRQGEKDLILANGWPINVREVLDLCEDKSERIRALAGFEDLYGWKPVLLPKLQGWKVRGK